MESETRSFTALPCNDFVEILASKAAVPGGGGASALVGSIGVALGHMVGSLTLGKKKYAAVEEDIQRCQQKANSLAKRLLDLMDEDARAFEPLSKVYGLPHATPEETARKAQVMEQALLTACGAPMEILHACAEAIDLMAEYAAKGSRLALSDAGAGAALLKGALQAASLNIYINAKSLQDRAEADRLTAEADRLVAEYGAKADEIFSAVQREIR